MPPHTILRPKPPDAANKKYPCDLVAAGISMLSSVFYWKSVASLNSP